MISIKSYSQDNILSSDLGPNGLPYHEVPSIQTGSNSKCIVNGINISTSGTSTSGYTPPNNGNFNICNDINASTPAGIINNWTSFSSSGFITYTFSSPITFARISYSAVNEDDVAELTINSPGMQLSDPCGLIISGNTISCIFPAPIDANGSYGNVAITVSSITPFTQITLQNIGGNSGWVSGNPCNFILTPPVEVISVPKVEFHFCSNSGNLTSSNSLLDGVTVDGNPANSSNVSIFDVVPTDFNNPAIAFNIIPVENRPPFITVNGSGTITISDTALEEFGVEFFIEICSGNNCSFPIRCDVYRFVCGARISMQNQFVVSPNPSNSGFFNVSFDDTIKLANLTVYNMFGENVFSDTIENKKDYQLILDQIPKGIYILKLFDGEETVTKYIVK